VRGFQFPLVDRAQDRFQHTSSVLQHIIVPKSENEITFGFKNSRSFRIAHAFLIVLTSVDFHDELPARTIEIDDKSIDRHLALKFQTGESTIPQAKP
jgi:hypothetical protein